MLRIYLDTYLDICPDKLKEKRKPFIHFVSIFRLIVVFALHQVIKCIFFKCCRFFVLA